MNNLNEHLSAQELTKPLAIRYCVLRLKQEQSLKEFKEQFNQDLKNLIIEIQEKGVSKRNIDNHRTAFEKLSDTYDYDSPSRKVKTPIEISEFIFSMLMQTVNENKSNSQLAHKDQYEKAYEEIIKYYTKYFESKEKIKEFKENQSKELNIIVQEIQSTGIPMFIIKYVYSRFKSDLNVYNKSSNELDYCNSLYLNLKNDLFKEINIDLFTFNNKDDIIVKDKIKEDKMHNITNIINELNENNSSNYKLEVLRRHKEDLLLQRVLKMTADKAVYNYGVGKKTLKKLFEMTMVFDSKKFITLEEALDILENEFCTRKVTGNEALTRLYDVFTNLNIHDSEIITKIINRDLKINVGKSQINKVFKDLITKPSYNRCDTYSDKTSKNINFKNGAYVQLKSDGTYREFTVNDSEVSCVSRSGEEYEYPLHNEILKNLPDSKYTGELTVRCSERIISRIKEKLAYAQRLNHETSLLEEMIEQYEIAKSEGKEYILPRSFGNGLINSLPEDIPHEDIVIELWDMITFEDYNLAKSKDKKNMPKEIYDVRFEKLKAALSEINSDKVKLIPSTIVYSLKEALQITSQYMSEGLEGAILKDKGMLYKDGTNKNQLKLKLHIEVEMRFTEFVEGNKGSKNEDYFSAVKFQNDEGTIKGQIGVTTMTEDERDFFHANRDKIINSIATLKCNDLIKATNNDYYALSHVSFVELRADKNETDSLEKVFKIRDAAMLLESKI